MRVTFNSQYRQAAAGIGDAAERLVAAQQQVATNRRVSRPSDDPTAAAGAVAERAQLAATDQYARAANSTAARLNVTDTVLSNVLEQLTAVQATAFSGIGTTASAAQREAAAQQLEGLRTSLISEFNATFHGTYIFAGAAATTKPFVETGGVVGAYAGSTREVAIDISEARAVIVGFDGGVIARGSDAQDVFAVLSDLVTAVRAGDDAGATTAVAGVQRAFDRVTTAQSRVGTALKTIESEQARLQDLKLAATERLAGYEDADMAQAITEMTRAEAAYQAALGATAQANRVSLLDYLG
jgi:flagellar hook-associated protein 3 FlgL